MHEIKRETITGSIDIINETFDIPNLAEGEYTQVRATWIIDKATAQGLFSFSAGNRMHVLGKYYHTAYNTPEESVCGGVPADACVSDSQCNYTEVSMLSQFIFETKQNGSGSSINEGLLQWGKWCWENGYPLSGKCTVENTFGKVTKIKGVCPGNNYVIADKTLARYEDDPNTNCGDKIYIHGHGVKTITDYCPACISNKQGVENYRHLDNYAGVSGCNKVTEIGDGIMTIKLY